MRGLLLDTLALLAMGAFLAVTLRWADILHTINMPGGY